MSWFLVISSGALEAVWATALNRSQGLSRPMASLIFFVALALSMTGLGLAMRQLPVGTAYVVWVGTGAAVTVAYAAATGAEPLTPAKLAVVAVLIGCVVALKVLH